MVLNAEYLRRAARWSRRTIFSVPIASLLGGNSHEELIVSIYDLAPAPKTFVGEAVATASGIYRSAGIESQWTVWTASDPQPACAADRPSQTRLQIKILPPGVGASFASRNAYGFSFRSRDRHAGFLGYAFYDRIESSARNWAISPGVMLGVVMAHEAGHLLGLPDSSGVMHRPFTIDDFRRAEKGFLRFSASDALRLRSLVAARNAASEGC